MVSGRSLSLAIARFCNSLNPTRSQVRPRGAIGSGGKRTQPRGQIPLKHRFAISTPISRIERAGTWDEASEEAWGSIEGHLHSMDPYEFQDLVGSLLEAMGYHVLWKAEGGKDGGVDLIAHRDPLGATEPRIKVQVKRRVDKTSAVDLRSFSATLGDREVGIYVSLGGFTGDAETEWRQPHRRLTLVDARKLVELWIEHLDKVDIGQRHLLPLRPIYYLAPEE